MNARVASLAAVAAVLLAYLGLGGGPLAKPPHEVVRAPARGAASGSGSEAPFPERDPFRFDDELPAEPALPLVPVTPSSAPSATPPPGPPPVRLVGFVRRGNGLAAALFVNGEVVLAGPGDDAGGFAVLAVDEEGVRLRGPDGRELSLVAEPDPPS